MRWIKKRKATLSSPYEDEGLHAPWKALSLSVQWFLARQSRVPSSGPPAWPAWGPWYSQELSTHRTLIAMRLPIGTKNRIIFPCASKSPVPHVRPESTTDILEHRKKLDICQLDCNAHNTIFRLFSRTQCLSVQCILLPRAASDMKK